MELSNSTSSKMKIGVLTSSRADYGIYNPLLKLLRDNDEIELHLIVFGMHLMSKYGSTLSLIEKDQFGQIHQVTGMPSSDDVLSVTEGYGDLIKQFGKFWSTNRFDHVICLGDRFEMSAAVQASIPFEVSLAHVHGGETTLGATDNIYRHQITLASKFHFTATDQFRDKVIELIGEKDNVYSVGALSLDGLKEVALPDWKSVCLEYDLPDNPFILITIHPETVGAQKNTQFAKETLRALLEISNRWNLVITMPNADVEGSVYREMLLGLKKKKSEKVHLIENFGREKYFSAMKACDFLLGNTSSGILEAASFGKCVVNIGDRQKGRLQSKNVINVPFNSNEIVKGAINAGQASLFEGKNLYHKENTAINILNILRGAKL